MNLNISGDFMANAQKLIPAQELAATNKAHFPRESGEYRAARNALLIEEIELRRQLERAGHCRRAARSRKISSLPQRAVQCVSRVFLATKTRS